MTPLEINKKIAELKKLNWVESNTTNPALVDLDSLPISLNFHPPKNWAENISDAWALFEEMDFIPVIKSYKNYSGFLDGTKKDVFICYTFFENKGLIYSAETAPMAICLAWIAWKESNENKK